MEKREEEETTSNTVMLSSWEREWYLEDWVYQGDSKEELLSKTKVDTHQPISNVGASPDKQVHLAETAVTLQALVATQGHPLAINEPCVHMDEENTPTKLEVKIKQEPSSSTGSNETEVEVPKKKLPNEGPLDEPSTLNVEDADTRSVALERKAANDLSEASTCKRQRVVTSEDGNDGTSKMIPSQNDSSGKGASNANNGNSSNECMVKLPRKFGTTFIILQNRAADNTPIYLSSVDGNEVLPGDQPGKFVVQRIADSAQRKRKKTKN